MAWWKGMQWGAGKWELAEEAQEAQEVGISVDRSGFGLRRRARICVSGLSHLAIGGVHMARRSSRRCIVCDEPDTGLLCQRRRAV